MYTPDIIEQHCGVAAAKYVQNKSRGGRNNAQGATYEAYFAASRIARLLAECMRSGDEGQAIWVEEQRLCFIDDFIVEGPATRTHSQLKSGAAGWDGGNHPLSDDFRLQKKLDDALGVASDYELVVSDAQQQQELAGSCPPDIAVSVTHFVRTTDVNELLDAYPEIVSWLDEIALHEPRPSVRDQCFRTLLAAWVTSPYRMRLADLAARAASGPGPVVAQLGPEYVLPQAVTAQLQTIEGLDFEIRKKHLYFRFGPLRGFSAFRGGTAEFTAFERFVVEEKPSDAFEVIARLRGDA